MKNISIAIGGLVFLFVAGAWYWTSFNQQSSSSVASEQARIVTHRLVLTARVLTPSIVTVTEGDEVTLKVITDETGEFHVSGYEIENAMTAGTELSFSFTADKAGRYNFELHPIGGAEAAHADEEDIVVGAFVVNPR